MQILAGGLVFGSEFVVRCGGGENGTETIISVMVTVYLFGVGPVWPLNQIDVFVLFALARSFRITKPPSVSPTQV